MMMVMMMVMMMMMMFSTSGDDVAQQVARLFFVGSNPQHGRKKIEMAQELLIPT
jgi:hypothetical protein